MWEISVYNQILTFAWSLVLGAGWCFVYDIITAVRRAYLWSYWIVFISDVLMWVIFAFVTFIFLISRTNGEIRTYVLLGELSGFLILRISISRFIVKFFILVFTKIKKLCDYVRCGFYQFFEKSEQISLKTIKNIVLFLKSAVKTVKKLLQYIHKLLYTNKNNANVENISDETKAKT